MHHRKAKSTCISIYLQYVLLLAVRLKECSGESGKKEREKIVVNTLFCVSIVCNPAHGRSSK